MFDKSAEKKPLPKEEAAFSLAPPHLRFFAFLLDYLVILGVVKQLELWLLPQGWDLLPQDSSPFPVPWWLLLSFFFLLKDIFPWGSPGKWFLGLLLCQASSPGKRLAFYQRAGRNFGLLLFPIELYLMLFHPYYQRLGDTLTGSVVLLAKNPLSRRRRLLVMCMFFLALLLGLMLSSRQTLKRTEAYAKSLQILPSSKELDHALGIPLRPRGVEELALQEETALVILKVQGAKKEGRVEVSLKKRTNPLTWELENLKLQPEKETTKK